MKVRYDEYGNEYDNVVTYCDIYKCDDCPRMGDDCDGKDFGEDEVEADGFITRNEDLKPLERAGENRATPVKDCLYPKCEDCDKYHGHYCTVPMVISKQYLTILEDKIADLMKRVLDLENLVYDKILGDREWERKLP